tara:strand:+ start:320 stop:682 length:363 start_codon:yes stop_codon:yes gene_type:complete
MGILSSLFGSDSVIDAGINGIDALVFTDEEKSTAKMKFLKLYEPYKIAQRWLMLFVCVPYVSLWSLTGVIYLIDIFTPRELDTSRMMLFLNGDVGSSFIIIVAFYFGGGAVEGIFSRLKK